MTASGNTAAAHTLKYGPFERSWRSVWLAVILLVIAVAFVVVAGRSQSLTCERDSGRDGKCILATNYLFVELSSDKFPLEEVRRVQYYRNIKGGGGTEVHFRHRATLMLDGASRDEYEKLHDFFSDRRERKVYIATWPSRWMLFIVPFFLFLGAGIMFGFLRRPTTIEVDVGDGQLRLRERWLGIALRNRQVSLDDVRGLKLVRQFHNTLLRPGPDRPAAQISLTTSGGVDRALTRRPLFGGDVHTEFANELAEVLGIEVAEIDDQA